MFLIERTCTRLVLLVFDRETTRLRNTSTVKYFGVWYARVIQ